MLSYLNHCIKKFSDNYPQLIKALEERVFLALVKGIPLLEKIAEQEKLQEQIEHLECERIEILIRKFYQFENENSDSENDSYSFFSFRILNYDEIKEFNNIKSSFTKHEEKILAGWSIVQRMGAEKPELLDKVLFSVEVISFNFELKILERKLQGLNAEVDKLAKNSPFKIINKQLEALYELENLSIVYQVGEDLFRQLSSIPKKEKEFAHLAFIQLMTLLREATHLVISDLNLNLKMDSVKPLVHSLKTIRNFFEHPEDYFLTTLSNRKELQKEEFKKLFSDLQGDLKKMLSLFKKRIDKISKLIEPHPSKDPQDVLTALAYRDIEEVENSDGGKKIENYSLVKEILLEKFPFVNSFSSQVMRKTDFWGLKADEKAKIKPFLYDPFPRTDDASEIIHRLITSIETLRKQLKNLNRRNFELRLLREVPFRLTIQRQISEIHRLIEDFFDKKIYIPKSSPITLEHLEQSFYAIKDVRNFQTHDLWRQNVKGLVNVVYLIVYDFSEMLQMITQKKVAYTYNSLENRIAQHICDGTLDASTLDQALEEGLKVDAFDCVGRSFLHFLAESPSPKNLKWAEIFISLGSNIHQATYHLMRPLHVACQSGFYDLVVLLIKQGAVTDLYSDVGTPLEIAQNYENHQIAKLISSEVGVSRGSDARALLDASKNLDYPTIKLLIEQGADASLNFEGYLPLVALFTKASARPQLVIKIAKLLLGAGAYIDQQEPATGDSPLHTACLYMHDPLIINFLMKLQPNVNLLNKNQRIPLHEAITTHSILWTQALLKAGSKTAVVDSIGFSPLLYASHNMHGPSEIVRLLLEYGANANEESEFGSVLHHAMDQGKLESVEYLLRGGATPFIKGKKGLYRNGLPFQATDSVDYKSRILEWMRYLFSHLKWEEQKAVGMNRKVIFLNPPLNQL